METKNGSANELGNYIEILIRQWQLVGSIILVCALSTGIVSLLLPKSYSASVLIATTKLASSVSFDTDIQTISEEDLLAGVPGNVKLVDPQMRLNSYLEMVKNPAIAQKILDQYGNQLASLNDGNTVSIEKLLEFINGELAGKSDTIRITATVNDPVLAAKIADAWGRAYVEEINRIFSDVGQSENLKEIQDQTKNSKVVYDQAQTEYRDNVSRSRANEYGRQIEERQQQIESLKIARSNTFDSIISQQSQASLTAFSEQLNDMENRLKRAYSDKRNADLYLKNAKDMQIQVLNGGDGAAASNVLALNLLKAQVFAAFGGLGDNLQIQTAPIAVNSEQMLTDLEGLILSLEERTKLLDDEIALLSNQLTVSLSEKAQIVVDAVSQLSGLKSSLDLFSTETEVEQEILKLEQEIRSLQALKSDEDSYLEELTLARDLAFQTYLTLSTKETERGVANQVNGINVSYIAPAVIPQKDNVSVGLNILISLVAGLILGILLAFVIEIWWSYKGDSPKPVVRIFSRRKQ